MRAMILAAALAVFCTDAAAQDGRAAMPETIETVTLHRLHRDYYMCGDHLAGELAYLGDALGTDCVIFGGLDPNVQGGFVRAFNGDGMRNEDWFSWNAQVLAPIDGVVRRVHVNEVVNQPATLGSPPASFILFERADGLSVLLAHVQDVQVAVGDVVRAGQFVARVGNNGYGRNPHIHVGAWKGQTPYQIRWYPTPPAAAEE